MIGGLESTKTNALLNLIKHQQEDVNKIYLYVKDPFESKYQLLINQREKVEIQNLKNPEAFTDYSQTINNVYENWEDYNLTKKRRVLKVFDDMIAGMDSNNKLSPIVTELFLRGRKFNISLFFISQFYFKLPKTIRLNATNYFIMKIPNKRELHQIASNHSPDINFNDFVKLYKEHTKEPYSFLVKDATFPLVKYIFVEYSWNIFMIYFQNIWKKFPMKFQGISPK